jgi:hypothetical protein
MASCNTVTRCTVAIVSSALPLSFAVSARDAHCTEAQAIDDEVATDGYGSCSCSRSGTACRCAACVALPGECCSTHHGPDEHVPTCQPRIGHMLTLSIRGSILDNERPGIDEALRFPRLPLSMSAALRRTLPWSRIFALVAMSYFATGFVVSRSSRYGDGLTGAMRPIPARHASARRMAYAAAGALIGFSVLHCPE